MKQQDIPAAEAIRYFAGELEAIDTVRALGASYGYGNLISHLKGAWSEMLQRKHGLPSTVADASAGFVCPWCHVDCRTGKKQRHAKNTTRKPGSRPRTR